MKLTTLLCIVLLVFISATVKTPFEKIIDGFNRYVLEQPQEKIYVHLDRTQYFSGETIWLKSYLTEGPNHEASQLSATVYVELVNESKEVVKQIKQFVQNGSSFGSIVLPDTLTSGNYVVRAYTNWMRNFSDEYFFYRTIKISDLSLSANIKKTEDRISVQFFPEGGDLVKGIDSRVGFKAVGENGLARQVQGKVLDAQGNYITSLKSNLLGMGAFILTPESGKTYHAIIDGVSEPVSLPVIRKEGIALSVINLPQHDKVSIQIQATSYKEDEVYLLVQSRGVVSYSPTLPFTASGVSTKLDKAQLPEGINQITLLNKNGQPLCERLIYIEKPEKQLTVSLMSDKKIYEPREKVTLTIDAKDAQGKPVAANWSLAVSDDQQNAINPYRETMHAYLTLSSDLRGHIESPGYYFDENNPDRHMALDWLLMTQGWRRFTIDQALNYDIQKFSHHSEQGITVKGKMVDNLTKKPIQQGKVTYLGLGSNLKHQQTTTNAAGEFELRNIVYFDSSKLVLQGETQKGKRWIKFVRDTSLVSPEVNIQLLDQQEVSNPDHRQLVSNALDRKEFDMAYNFDEHAVMLEELVVKAKRDVIHPNRIYGPAGKTVVVEGDKSLENLLNPFQLLQGRHAGIMVTGSGLFYRITMRGKSPMILLDNLQVDTRTLSTIPVRDIESFDIWKGPEAAVFGSDGANGVIAFYTKRGKNQPYKIEGIYKFSSGGYTVSREFYSPTYDVDNAMNMPDKRATLFWAPNVQTDSTGRATISFYNHDVVTSVTGIIEGITSSGHSGSATYQYEIKKN